MAKTEKKIIELLAMNPDREFYGAEIASEIKCSKGAASGIVNKLAEKKMINIRSVGNMKFCRINNANLAVKNFKIALATERLGPVLEKLKKAGSKAILFGSASRGEQTRESDIDLLIVSREKDRAREVIKSSRLNKVIKAIFKTQAEWSEMEISDPEFYHEINRGIVLFDYVSRV